MAGQTIKMAWASIVSNKMRSFLTMLGIIIGVIALVVLVSIANSATSQVTDAISSMGTDTLTVTITDDKENPLKLSEMSDILDLDHVQRAAATATDSATGSYGENSETVSLTGTTGDYMDIEGLTLASGRWLKKSDVDSHTNVAVINTDVAGDILGVTNTGDAIGMELQLDGIPYTVVGVLADSDSVFSSMSSYEAYIPYSSLQRLSSSVSSVTSFVVGAGSDDATENTDGDSTDEGEELDAAEESLEAWLLARFDDDEDAFSITNMSTIADTMSEVTNMMSVMIGGIAAISLLVGGIGIMNIMLVSVTERTREIGIRKAIGATEGSILFQFLLEALILSLMGCFLGIIGSWGIIQIIAKVTGNTYTLNTPVCIVAAVFSLAIGLIFGIYPARRAAKKKPIEALHYAG